MLGSRPLLAILNTVLGCLVIVAHKRKGFFVTTWTRLEIIAAISFTIDDWHFIEVLVAGSVIVAADRGRFLDLNSRYSRRLSFFIE